MSDGKIEIDVSLNTTEFDKKYQKLQNKLEKDELDLNIKASELDNTKKELQSIANELENIRQKREKLTEKISIKQAQYDRINNTIESGKSISGEEYQRLGYLDTTLSRLKNEQKDLNKEFDKYNDKLNKANDLLVKAQSKYDVQKSKVKETRMEVEELNKEILESRKATNGTNVDFSKMGKTLKRLAFSLFGLRSAYALVSRASSAYLSVDTELAEKLKSVWVGLGAFLSPLLEEISNALLKALGYLNVFIKALTGIDFLAKANAKALNNQAKATSSAAKAQKELNKQQYDFDVIRTQQENTSSSGSGGASVGGFDGLFDIPELDEKLVQKLQDLAKWLKENWYWIKEVGKALLITFGAVEIGKILKNLALLFGGKESGLLGLQSILTGLATIGVITLGVYLLYTALTGRDLIEDLKNIKIGIEELKKATQSNTEADKKYSEGLDDLTNKIKNAIEVGKLTPDLLKTTTDFLKETTNATAEQVKVLNEDSIQTKEVIEEKKELAKQLEKNIETYKYLYEQGLLNEEETENYKDAIATLIATKISLGEEAEDLMQQYRELDKATENAREEADRFKTSEDKVSEKLDYIAGKNWKFSVTADTVQAENSLTNFVNRINSKFEKALKLNVNTSGTMGFAKGGIVTQPTRAVIGEAGYPEAVVPMTQDYLSTLASEIVRAGGTNSGGGVTNIYLDGRLIQRQIDDKRTQNNFVKNV